MGWSSCPTTTQECFSLGDRAIWCFCFFERNLSYSCEDQKKPAIDWAPNKWYVYELLSSLGGVCNAFGVTLLPFIFSFLWFIEPSSGFWYPGTTQSRDLSALSNSDAQSCETQVVWSPKRKEIKENNLNRGRIRNMGWHEDVWLKDLLVSFPNQPECPSSSLTNVSLKLFQDENKESKVVSVLPVAPGNLTSNHRLKLGNESMSILTDRGKISEARNGCRLFGIELIDSSNNSHPTEKTSMTGLFNISDSAMVAAPTQATVYAADSDQLSGLPRASKEQKLSLQTSPKEVQSKQTCSTTRSRTKVRALKGNLCNPIAHLLCPNHL